LDENLLTKLQEDERGDMERIKKLFRDESGASGVEYGLLLALIAVAIIAGVSTLGENIAAIFTNASNVISTAIGT
jgi:pilus assembly protein Flp/PilA